MIAFVRGRVAAVAPDGAVVEVGGVGLAVLCTPATLAGLRLGDEATLATSLVVREDSLTLYGFVDDDERTVFELLQTASGVGPRLAQAVLAVHRPDDLRRALAAEDLTALTRVPGVGRKGAQRMVLELRDRLGAASSPATPANPGGGPGVPAGWQSQVHAGLLGLGWSAREADEAVAAVAPEAERSAADGGAVDGGAVDGGAVDVAGLLRAALRALSRT